MTRSKRPYPFGPPDRFCRAKHEIASGGHAPRLAKDQPGSPSDRFCQAKHESASGGRAPRQQLVANDPPGSPSPVAASAEDETSGDETWKDESSGDTSLGSGGYIVDTRRDGLLDVEVSFFCTDPYMGYWGLYCANGDHIQADIVPVGPSDVTPTDFVLRAALECHHLPPLQVVRRMPVSEAKVTLNRHRPPGAIHTVEVTSTEFGTAGKPGCPLPGVNGIDAMVAAALDGVVGAEAKVAEEEVAEASDGIIGAEAKVAEEEVAEATDGIIGAEAKVAEEEVAEASDGIIGAEAKVAEPKVTEALNGIIGAEAKVEDQEVAETMSPIALHGVVRVTEDALMTQSQR